MISAAAGACPDFILSRKKAPLGQRMKADIGMAFPAFSQALYLDEPTIGLDINIKHTIRSFLRQMNQEKGVSIFPHQSRFG